MPKRLAASLSILAALIALFVSLPFAAAYFRAYGAGEPTPTWLAAFGRAFPELLNFDQPARVYQFYGRLYALVIPLTLPALLVLKRWIGTSTRFSRWGWRMFFGGALLVGLGVIGDYFPDPSSFWVGMGFMLELGGTLILWGGAVLYGIASLQEGRVSRWFGSALIGVAPGGILGMALFAHIPSGPLLGYVVFWLVAGFLLLSEEQGVEL